MKTDNINVNGLDLEVGYFVHEGEDEVLNYGDGTGNPGSGTTIDLAKVIFEGVNILPVVLAYDELFDDIVAALC